MVKTRTYDGYVEYTDRETGRTSYIIEFSGCQARRIRRNRPEWNCSVDLVDITIHDLPIPMKEIHIASFIAVESSDCLKILKSKYDGFYGVAPL
jgi:hypothetical protein